MYEHMNKVLITKIHQMKRIFTLPKEITTKNAVMPTLAILLVSFLFFVGCYEWINIFQPEEVAVNSYFDVWLSAHDDGNPDNDWTNPDNHDIGLFGVMLPDGWTVQDSIPYFIKTTEPGYDNNGIVIHNDEHSQTLTDSIPPPPGYYWWGAKTDGEASLVYFDSLYLEPRIFTNDQTGNFALRYAIGDEDYWDRNPADDVSDPIPITVYDPTGKKEIFAETNISIYPNPAVEYFTVNFENYLNQVIELSITDMTGKTVMVKKLYQNKNQIQIGDLTRGMYFINLQSGSDKITKKIIVK